MNVSPDTSPSTEFTHPPQEPLGLLRRWLDQARTNGVRDPHHMALATCDPGGRLSSRTIALLEVRDEGLVFASHATSPKGRDLAANPRASAVLYWRETLRQIVVNGAARPLPAAESDRLWGERPLAMQPMSVLSRQSAPLEDEHALREEARSLASQGKPLERPTRWVGYLLEPDAIEFWQSGDPDRLYQRLLYEGSPAKWRTTRLQP